MSFCSHYFKNTLSTFAVLLALTACGGGSGGNDLPVSDTTPPRVIKTEPASGSTISVNNFIIVSFNEAIQLPESINLDLYQYNDDGSLNNEKNVPLSTTEVPFSLDSTSTILTIRPLADIKNNKPFFNATKYQVNLIAIKDIENNRMVSICRFEFVTEGYLGSVPTGISLCGAQISSRAPTTISNLASGEYNKAQAVSLTCSDKNNLNCEKIYYTLDGSTPSSNSSVYINPINIDAVNTKTILKYYGVDRSGLIESIKTEIYTIDILPPATAVSPKGSNYRDVQFVVLSCTDLGGASCAKTFYTLDNFVSESKFLEYTGAIRIAALDTTTTLRYMSIDSAGNIENIKSEDYTITNKLPITKATPPGSVVKGNTLTIALDCSTADVSVSTCTETFYTINNSVQIIYNVPFNISLANDVTNLKFYSIDSLGNKELVKSEIYELDSIPPETNFIASSQFYNINKPTSVVLKCIDSSTAGCDKTYYTLDGAIPTVNSIVYKYPIDVITTNLETTINYFSIDIAGNVESVKSQTLKIDNTKPKTVSSTTATKIKNTNYYPGPITVDLICTDNVNGSGCKQTYFTIDGSIPSLSSNTTLVYNRPITLNSNTELRFFSVDNMGNSENTQIDYYGVSVSASGINIGPEGGDINSILFDSNKVYIGTKNYALYERTMNSTKWISKKISLIPEVLSKITSIDSIAIHPTAPLIIFAATNAGLYKTINGGLSWRFIVGRYATGYKSEIKYDPVDPRILHYVNVTDIYRSTDGGDSFSAPVSLGGAGSISINPNGLNMFLATDSGLYRSVDKGFSWTNLYQNEVFKDVTIDSNNVSIIYAITSNKVYKSIDAGVNWNLIKTDSVNSNSIVVASGTLYLADASDVFKSTNSGTIWKKIFTIPNSIINVLAINPANSAEVLAGSTKGIYRTSNSGTTWIPWNSNLIATEIDVLEKDPLNPDVLYASVNNLGIVRFNKNAVGWSDFGNYNQTFGLRKIIGISIDPFLNSNNFRATYVISNPSDNQYLNITDYSSDDGVTWFNLSLSNVYPDIQFSNIIFDNKSTGIMYATTTGRPVGYDAIYKSEDFGLSWNTLSNGIPAGVIIKDVLIDSIDVSILYINTGQNIFKSTDYGVSWVRLTIGARDDLYFKLIMNKNNPGELYLTSLYYLYKTTNGGATWSVITSSSTKAFSVTVIAISSLNSDIMYSGTDNGISRSKDNGKSWSPVIIDSMNSKRITSLHIDDIDDNILYVGTSGAGVWKITVMP